MAMTDTERILAYLRSVSPRGVGEISTEGRRVVISTPEAEGRG